MDNKRIHAERRGEWLELMPGQELDLQKPEQRHTRMMAWLESQFFPVKLLGRLHSKGEIKVDGDRIRLRIFPEADYGFEPRYEQMPETLYEDDYVLVVHKPAGMAVHPSDRQDTQFTLAHAVAAYFESTGQPCAVRHVHRLDEDTTGPVLYAKNELALSILDEQMRAKEIDRRYIAIVQGRVNEQLTIIDEPIGKDRHHKQRRRVSDNGQEAITHIEPVRSERAASLVRLKLETGRTHQIRVHMSYMGHPLVGDSLYGGRSDLLDRQALHGEQLTFMHPWTRERIVVDDPWPEDMAKVAADLKLI